MFLIFAAILASAAPDPLEACTRAVHGDLSAAASACAEPSEKIDLFASGGVSDPCRQALKAGRDAGMYRQHLSEAQRAGLIREYDKRAAACHAPEPAPVPTRPTTQLWD